MAETSGTILRPALSGPYHCEWDERAQAFRIWDSPPDEDGSHFMEIATLPCPDQPSYQSHQPAHARLLTAAPELLAALKRIVDDVGDGFNCDPDQETLAQCWLAIHKAERRAE